MSRTIRAVSFAFSTLAALAAACSGCNDPASQQAAQHPVTPGSASTGGPNAPSIAAQADRGPAGKLDKVPRDAWNRLAAEIATPIFWVADTNGNGALDPNELAVYWGLDRSATLSDYVSKGAFTTKFFEAYDRIATKHAGGADPAPKAAALDGAEAARRVAVKKELGQGRMTLVATDVSKMTPAEKSFVASILKASELIEKIYAKQQGTTELAAKVRPDDPAGRMLFFRSQGPKCEAPLTEHDPACAAIPVADMPKGKLSGLYPADMLAKPKFCDELKGSADKALTNEFTSIGGTAAAPKAIPYNEAYAADMKAVASELTAAAGALGETEPALKAYLLAAAKSFGDNAWWPADEAWAKMDAKNSKFYLRIAPDEVYDEPCSTKALFHVSFGLINQGSLKWQAKLDPLKTQMENALAAMAGAPYKARSVTFKLPDFVDIALNAGDSRKAFGATIGQSLPNFGPVANEGRGRTVAMTNFYTDPDSIAALKDQAESLLCKSTMAVYTTDQEPQLMSTVLHEAAHNLGPAHQYKVNGKVDREVFGGPLASTLEELKAQTAALYFTDWLAEKKTITQEEANRAHVRDLTWAFGHISRGMYTEEHHPKNYSQLAAIQVGWLMKNGALAWRAEETAANGKDKGCFAAALDKYPPVIKSMMTEVAQIKGKGDKVKAEALIKQYVDAGGDVKKTLDVITERMLRSPKASFVYAIKAD